MNRINYCTIIALICLVSTLLLQGCSSISSTNNSNEENSMIKYYEKEDFDSIIIGESTYKDVYEIAPIESMQITSYGGLCEYPMQNGGCVQIKFYGKDLIVSSIEEVSVT